MPRLIYSLAETADHLRRHGVPVVRAEPAGEGCDANIYLDDRNVWHVQCGEGYFCIGKYIYDANGDLDSVRHCGDLTSIDKLVDGIHAAQAKWTDDTDHDDDDD